MLLDGIHQGLVAGQGGHGIGQQQTLDIHTHCIFAGVATSGVEIFDGPGDDRTDMGFDFCGVLFGNHAAVDLEHHLAGHHVGVGAAVDAADVEIWVLDARYLGGDLLVLGVLGIQRIHQHYGSLQRIHPRMRHGSVGHLALHGNFHLQAAVVGRHHFVAEAGCDHQIGLGQPLLQQPARAHDAAELFVVGVVQLHRTLGGFGHGFEGTHGVGEAGEIALAHRGSAAVELAIHDFGAIGVLGPALAGRHHIAVGVQGDGAARACAAVLAAHDQVGDRFHAIGLDLGFRHHVPFGFVAKVLEQLGRTFGVGRIVAGRRIGGNLHQLLEELHFFVKVLVDPLVQGCVGGCVGHAASFSSC
ncbi:hypothetical protein D3C72_1102570 [compost metagenome]